MPSILQQALPSIAFSKNKIALKVHSDNFRTATPVKAVGKLLLTGALAEGNTISLNWITGSATLTAKVAPDDSGLQIPAGDGGNAHAQQILLYLQSSPFIARDYKVTVDITGAHPFFTFSAHKAGTNYNLNTLTGTSYETSMITPGVSAGLLPNFMHFISVLVLDLDGAGFTTVFDYNVALDDVDSGTTSIDIAELLHAYLAFDIPSLTGSYWQACTASVRKYKVRYGQYYGDPAYVRQVTTTALNSVIYGGYSNLALQQIGNNATYLQNYLLPASGLYKFQRWFEAWPVDRFTVKTNQPQFLYFINSRTIAETYKIKADLVFDNGDLQTVYLNGGTLPPLSKACVGCGYKQLGLNAYSSTGRLVTSYTISLVESATLEGRSLSKVFNINRDYEAYSRYFIYSDSVGNFKTLRTYGASQLTADISADQVSLQTDPSVMPVTGNYRNSNIKSVHNDKVNTGYIVSAAAYNSLIELHQAKQVYRVFGTTLVPIVITSKNFNYSSDGTLLTADLLEYRLAYDDELYTADSYSLAVPQLNQSQQSINDI